MLDSTLNKLGLYQILSVMLSGVIVLLAGMYLDLFFLFAGESDIVLFSAIESDALKVVVFPATGYFVGIVLQEISAEIDVKLFQVRDSVKSDFLNVRIFRNPLELEDFKKMSNQILHKSEKNQNFSENEQLYVYFHCKDFLEVRNKDGKAETFSSLCGMSRNLMVAFPVLLLWYTVSSVPDVDICKILIFLSLTAIFYERAKKYGRFRVRTILRHYKMLTQTQ